MYLEGTRIYGAMRNEEHSSGTRGSSFITSFAGKTNNRNLHNPSQEKKNMEGYAWKLQSKPKAASRPYKK